MNPNYCLSNKKVKKECNVTCICAPLTWFHPKSESKAQSINSIIQNFTRLPPFKFQTPQRSNFLSKASFHNQHFLAKPSPFTSSSHNHLNKAPPLFFHMLYLLNHYHYYYLFFQFSKFKRFVTIYIFYQWKTMNGISLIMTLFFSLMFLFNNNKNNKPLPIVRTLSLFIFLSHLEPIIKIQFFLQSS